jgi:DNA ligase (NAD+)
LKALGFGPDQFAQRCPGVKTLMEFIAKNDAQRTSLPFEIDGVVVKVNSTEAQLALGRTAHAPRWAMAYKFSAQKAQTKILDIKLQVGRTGKITPVAHVSPVAVGGTIISRATLHNRDYIDEKKICVGSTVWIERSADVIPKITGLVDPKAPKAAGGLTLDWNSCPCELKSPLVTYEDRVDVFCVSPACPGQRTRTLRHFVSRQCLAMDGFGPRTVDDLVDNGFVKDVADIFFLHRYQRNLESLEGWGPRSVELLLNGIEEGRKNSNLERLLNGLSIVGVGKEIAIQLAKHFKTMDNLLKAKEGDILVAGAPIGPVVASSVYNFFHPKQPAAQQKVDDLLRRLREAEVNMTYSKASIAPSNAKKSATASSSAEAEPSGNLPLSGLVFVFTGKMVTMTRTAASETVENLGGEVKGAVTKGVTHLVTGDMTGESTKKLEAAQSKGIAVIDEKEFRKLCGTK